MSHISVQLVVGNEYLIGEIFSYAVGDASTIVRVSRVSKDWQERAEAFARTILDGYSLNPRISQFFKFPSFKKTAVGVIGEIYLSVKQFEKSRKTQLSLFPNLAPEDIRMLTLEQRGNCVCEAAWLGYEGIVELLLAHGPISEVDRGWAVRYAVQEGYRKCREGIVKLLLANGPISGDCRGEAVKFAVSYGQQRIVELLLVSGPISEGNLGLAVRYADGDGREEIANLLRSKCTVIDIEGSS